MRRAYHAEQFAQCEAAIAEMEKLLDEIDAEERAWDRWRARERFADVVRAEEDGPVLATTRNMARRRRERRAGGPRQRGGRVRSGRAGRIIGAGTFLLAEEFQEP